MEAIHPTTEAAFDGGVSDVIVNADCMRIEIFENLEDVPNRSAHQTDAGVCVIHRAHFVLGVQRGELGGAAMEIFKLGRERLIVTIFKAAPTVVANAETRQRPKHSAGIRAGGVYDV